MKTTRRILAVALGTVAMIVLTPILLQFLSTGAMRGYFEDGRCACNYESFIHLRGDGYFDEAPLHGMGEQQLFTLHRRSEEWELRSLPSAANSSFAVFAQDVTVRARIQSGDLYLAYAGRTNWTRHARVYNPWRIWLARLEARPPAQQITCVNNLKQIGLAFRQWAIDHEDRFPFNVGTDSGGTREFSGVDQDGFERDSAIHLQVMSNEFTIPKILVCPQDRSRKAATDFASLLAKNVTYRMRSGTNRGPESSHEVLLVCPMEGNTLYCDGTVKEGNK
jgi:hypothetical protein